MVQVSHIIEKFFNLYISLLSICLSLSHTHKTHTHTKRDILYHEQILWYCFKINKPVASQAPVAQAYNPSYLGGIN
jgi:hypothetical protein